MRLSNERIKSLQALMSEKCGLELTDQQAQEAGLAIMRFVIAKTQREKELIKEMEHDNGQQRSTERNYA